MLQTAGTSLLQLCKVRTPSALQGKPCPAAPCSQGRLSEVLQLRLRSALQAQPPSSTLTLLPQLWLALLDGRHDHVTHASCRQPVQAPLDALHRDDVQVLGACGQKHSASASLHSTTSPARPYQNTNCSSQHRLHQGSATAWPSHNDLIKTQSDPALRGGGEPHFGPTQPLPDPQSPLPEPHQQAQAQAPLTRVVRAVDDGAHGQTEGDAELGSGGTSASCGQRTGVRLPRPTRGRRGSGTGCGLLRDPNSRPHPRAQRRSGMTPGSPSGSPRPSTGPGSGGWTRIGADGGGWSPGPAPASPRFDILAPEEREARGARRDMGQHRPLPGSRGGGVTWRGCVTCRRRHVGAP